MSDASKPRKSFLRKLVVRTFIGIATVYVALAAFFAWALRQDAHTVSRVLAHTPMPVLMAAAAPQWNLARGGDLEVGGSAPDFELTSEHGNAKIRLSSFRGKKAVALIFGSYT